MDLYNFKYGVRKCGLHPFSISSIGNQLQPSIMKKKRKVANLLFNGKSAKKSQTKKTDCSAASHMYVSYLSLKRLAWDKKPNSIFGVLHSAL